MATIRRFEEVEAWKVGRELSMKIGTIIDEGNFKKSWTFVEGRGSYG